MTIDQIQNEIISEFDMFNDWTEKYEYIIDLGKSLPVINDAFKTSDNTIKGCQSKVWLYAEYINNKLIFTADSDAIITKGIVAILIRVFSNQSPKDIVDAKTDFIEKIGLKQHLSQTRANGLSSMIKQIKLYAVGYLNK
ncbi:MAG: SufE family protein [Flavobacteriaceae bacterium]|nr:SufE family protein [Flavobacteriaceae bacterium]MBT4113919.1 SufE family protein [Flavobacteriaceae bacterium]MBT4613881.1 SufE family protein [Flavobacteriaceae bacterium]MBT5246618.1 SufE family protein [Flavobacteriaceae bacterium]MBT5649601.1 SufE family protein [Flavobacteriaceae bacterium]